MIEERHAYHIECKRNFNHGCEFACGRELTIGDMSHAAAKRRLKRWFVAGLDDGAWPPLAKKEFHQKMGGFLLKEYSDEKTAGGISEEDLNRLISATVLS